MNHKYCFLVILSASLLGSLPESATVSGEQPKPVAIPTSQLFPHFPDRMHAVVWRNWQAVEPERIARVLGTSAENVTAVAQSMGLPPATSIPPEQKTRGYFWMTLCRRNWHLLPMDQLATLLDTTPEKLEQFLKVEEHANWIILGGFKPPCDPVRYAPPGKEVQRRAAWIKQIVEPYMKADADLPGEPRFAFVRRLSELQPSIPGDASHEVPASHPRWICSYLKIYGDPLMDPQVDMYPEGLLQRLAQTGVNGIWLYGVLRQLAPGGEEFPEFGDGHETRQANLRTLVARAKRYGIGVYLYLNEPRSMPLEFFKNRPGMVGVHHQYGANMCTSHPAVRKWLSDATAHLFAHVPDLAGVFTISASEGPTNCAWGGPGRKATCPQCRGRNAAEILAEVNAAIEAGVHRGNPKSQVIAWDWGWDWAAKANLSEIAARLPKSIWLLSISEWAQPINRGGVKGAIGEYSMSVVGPGPRALAQWDRAKQAGLKTAAKVQLNTTWEIGSLPYLPVMDLVATHCRNLADAGVEGMMLSWSLGGYPSPNLDVANRFTRKPTPSVDEVLDTVAHDRFGPAGAPHARRAWTALSRAFQEYPFSSAVVYSAPVEHGPANLLYPFKTGWSSTMQGFPFDDVRRWCRPYPPEIFASQFEKLAAGWEHGLGELRMAVAKTPAGGRCAVESDLRYAEAARWYFKSVANQMRFVLARDALKGMSRDVASSRCDVRRAEIQRMIEEEIVAAGELYRLARADSCIGFEAASQYFYLPLDLIEKIVNCRYVLERYSGDRQELQ